MQMLNHFDGKIQEQSMGKTKELVFNEGMQKILKEHLKLGDYQAEVLFWPKCLI